MLALCAGCGRHARAPACPFCGARVAPLPQFRGRNPKYKTAARVTRAAVHNFKSVSCR